MKMDRHFFGGKNAIDVSLVTVINAQVYGVMDESVVAALSF